MPRITVSDELWAGLIEIADARLVKPLLVVEVLLSNAVVQFKAGVDPLMVPMSKEVGAAVTKLKRPVGRPRLVPQYKDVCLLGESQVIVTHIPEKENIPEHILRKFLKYTPYLPIEVVSEAERPTPYCEYKDQRGHYFCEGVPVHPKGDFPVIDSTSDNPRRIYPVWWDSVYGEGSRDRMINVMYEQTTSPEKLERWKAENRRVDFDGEGEKRLQELNQEHIEKLKES